jgi:hypothetical protein
MILRHETAISVAVGLLVLVIQILTDGDTSWPRWVWYGLAIPLAIQAAIRRGLRARRIDRDLHDGAEARFVSVAMNLGLARSSPRGQLVPGQRGQALRRRAGRGRPRLS